MSDPRFDLPGAEQDPSIEEKRKKFAADPLRRKLDEYFAAQPPEIRDRYEGTPEDDRVKYVVKLKLALGDKPQRFTNHHDMLVYMNGLTAEQRAKVFRQKVLQSRIPKIVWESIDETTTAREEFKKLQNRLQKFREEDDYDKLTGKIAQRNWLEYEKERLKNELEKAQIETDPTKREELVKILTKEKATVNVKYYSVNQEIIALEEAKKSEGQEAPASASPEPVATAEPQKAEKEATQERLAFKADGKTRTKKDRAPEKNEDSTLVDTENNTYAIFDGMGGYKAGEEASRLSSETIQKEMANVPKEADFETFKEAFKQAFIKADRLLKEKYPDEKERAKTTASAIVIWKGPDGKERILVGQVGDSRVYRMRDGVLKPLTVDQGLIEAPSGKKRDVDEVERVQEHISNLVSLPDASGDLDNLRMTFLNRQDPGMGLGFEDFQEPIIDEITDLQEGDAYLLTSDGIHDNLTSTQIAEAAKNNTDPEKLTEKLISESIKAAKLRNELGNALRTVAKERGKEKVDRLGDMQFFLDEDQFHKAATDAIEIVRQKGVLPDYTDETAVIENIVNDLKILGGSPAAVDSFYGNADHMFYPRSKEDDMSAVVVRIGSKEAKEEAAKPRNLEATLVDQPLGPLQTFEQGDTLRFTEEERLRLLAEMRAEFGGTDAEPSQETGEEVAATEEVNEGEVAGEIIEERKPAPAPKPERKSIFKEQVRSLLSRFKKNPEEKPRTPEQPKISKEQREKIEADPFYKAAVRVLPKEKIAFEYVIIDKTTGQPAIQHPTFGTGLQAKIYLGRLRNQEAFSIRLEGKNEETKDLIERNRKVKR